jgi:acyl-coenzyme A synthetase/AMP-(fatty) acid ligase
MNVAPAEVEAVLLARPVVAEAYVVGVPDKDRGEAVVAFVRFAERSGSIEELHRHCSEVLASYKVPRTIVEMQEFPLTSTGKVSKKDLVELAQKRHDQLGVSP